MPRPTGHRAAVTATMLDGRWLDHAQLCDLLPHLTSRQVSTTIRHMREAAMLDIDDSAGYRKMRYRLRGVIEAPDPQVTVIAQGNSFALAAAWRVAGDRMEAAHG